MGAQGIQHARRYSGIVSPAGLLALTPALELLENLQRGASRNRHWPVPLVFGRLWRLVKWCLSSVGSSIDRHAVMKTIVGGQSRFLGVN